jgi:hypothetical protein
MKRLIPKTKKSDKPPKKQSLESRLRELFALDRLYTIDDLVKSTGHKQNYVRTKVSMIQNALYTENPVKLSWRRCPDGIKRFGNPSATKICS